MAFQPNQYDAVHAAFSMWRTAVLGTVRALHTRPANAAPPTEVDRATLARELAEDSTLTYAERCRAAVAALQNLQMPDHLRHHVDIRPLRRQNSNAFRSPNFHIVG